MVMKYFTKIRVCIDSIRCSNRRNETRSPARLTKSLRVMPFAIIALSGCKLPSAHAIDGTAANGLVTNATVTAFDRNGDVVDAGTSVNGATYTLDMPSDTAYPVTIRVAGGSDILSGTESGLTLNSVALDAQTDQANSNIFTTMLVKTAQHMPGGLTMANLTKANDIVYSRIGFGWDPALVPDPFVATINAENAATMLKSGVALSQAVMRTQAALATAGMQTSDDAVVDALAGDLSDGFIDGRGPGADARIAATFAVISADVLLEYMTNSITINGIAATSSIDAVVAEMVPAASTTTADVVNTQAVMAQAHAALAGAQALTAETGVDTLWQNLASVSGPLSSMEAKALIPSDARAQLAAALSGVAKADANQIDQVNSTMREVMAAHGNTGVALPEPSSPRADDPLAAETPTGAPNSTDSVAPVISLTGEAVMTLVRGEAYVERGATATDNIDGDLTNAIVISGSVDTSVAGTHHLNYDVKDTSGNAAQSVARQVQVVDPTQSATAAPWEDLVNNVGGFGRNATGGKGGEVCWVRNLNDAGAESLRACAESTGPKWIRFAVSGTITLNSMINVKSDKTIDGRGANIRITKYGLKLITVSNVIISNVKIENLSNSQPVDNFGDAIQIRYGTRDVWIDHVSMAGARDELLEIGHDSRAITVSWNRFSNSGFGMIVGLAPSQTESKVTTVTMHHNLFSGLNERAPRLRYGKVHAYNNYFYDWGAYSIGSSQLGQVNSQNNVFESVSSKSAIITQTGGSGGLGTDPQRGFAKSTGDLLLNGAQIDQNGASQVFDPNTYYTYTLDQADNALTDKIRGGTGWQDVAAP